MKQHVIVLLTAAVLAGCSTTTSSSTARAVALTRYEQLLRQSVYLCSPHFACGPYGYHKLIAGLRQLQVPAQAESARRAEIRAALRAWHVVKRFESCKHGCDSLAADYRLARARLIETSRNLLVALRR
jgi:hypothetical protein